MDQPLHQTPGGNPWSRLHAKMDSDGWDEILFSVSPDVLELSNGYKHNIADHGDVVGRPWTVEEHRINNNTAVCDMNIRGYDLDYEFSRRLELQSNQPVLNLHYTFEVKEDYPLPWFWCAHPLIAADEELIIELSDEQPFIANKQEYHWPRSQDIGEVTDLSRIFQMASKVSDATATLLATPRMVACLQHQGLP